MFTKKEKQMLGGGYFTIIREEEKFIEVRSNNTKHQWIIFKKSIDSDKPVTLYHKHWETWTVALAVESIKNHDTYVIENRETIRWMKQKGRINYGNI